MIMLKFSIKILDKQLVMSAEPGSSKLSKKKKVKNMCVWKMSFSRIGSYTLIFTFLQKVS